MKPTRVVFAGIAIAAAVACSQEPPTATPPPPPAPPATPPPPPGPQPPPPPPGQPSGSGRLSVSLTTPNSDDAAILLELRGSTIHGIALANSDWKMYADSSASPIRIVLAGKLTAGTLLTFDVPDVSAVSSYTATIVDVSDAQNRIRAQTGYSLGIAR